MGIGETGVGEMGVGETGPNRLVDGILILMKYVAGPFSFNATGRRLGK